MHKDAARSLAVTLFLLAGVSCGGSAPQAPLALRVMTFNVLCSLCNSVDYDPWADRLADFKDVFHRHAPDLLGTQELFTPAEVGQLVSALPPGFAALSFRWYVDLYQYGPKTRYPSDHRAVSAEVVFQ